MRTFSKLGIAVLGMALSAVFVVSCSKDDTFDGQKEVVIESKVLEQGADPEVSVNETGTDGIALSYDTWIRVYRRTNLSSTEVAGDLITVGLNNAIDSESSDAFSAEIKTRAENVDETASYNISYEMVGEPRQVKQYVTVRDSVLIVTRFVGKTQIEHRFLYQVAVYNDGKTEQVMPYYRYENLKDCGLKVEVENVASEDNMYKVTHYTSCFSVEFNGKTYTSVKKAEEKEVILDRLVSSKVVAEGNELLEQDNKNDYKGRSLSWIEVEQIWSESGTKKFKIEAILNNSMVPSVRLYSQNVPEQYDATFQIKREGIFSEPVVNSQKTEGNVTVTQYKQTYVFKCSAAYSEEKFFDLSGDFFYEVPVYKDELLQYEMPHFTYSQPRPIFSFSKWIEEDGVFKSNVKSGFYSNFGYEAVNEDVLWTYNYQTQFIYKP